MSSPHPLNQAVLAQAMHDLRNGQLRRCQAMGFGDDELEALKYPALVSVLLNAQVPWCSIRINRYVLHRLLRQVVDVEHEIRMVDRMLKLDASTEMLNKFYGLTNQEVALRRELLGLPKRKGRHPALSEKQENDLWQRWKDRLDADQINHDEDDDMLLLAMELAEHTETPLSVVWGAICAWVEGGQV